MTIQAPAFQPRTLLPRREAVATESPVDRPRIGDPERQPLPGGQSRLIVPSAGINAVALRRVW